MYNAHTVPSCAINIPTYLLSIGIQFIARLGIIKIEIKSSFITIEFHLNSR